MDNGHFDDNTHLIRSCIARDHSAWDFFTKKYSRLILSSIGNRLRKYGIHPKTDDLREIQQNVLSLLWESGKLAEVRNPESLKYWLAVVSGNTAVQYMRKQARIMRLTPVSISRSVGDAELIELLPSGAPTPAQELDKAELSRKIDEVIEFLPAKEKLAMKLSLFHCKKHEEISEIMSIPIGTVCSYIKRAKDKLRNELQGYI